MVAPRVLGARFLQTRVRPSLALGKDEDEDEDDEENDDLRNVLRESFHAVKKLERRCLLSAEVGT